MLPTLVDRIAVGIENVRCPLARIVIQARAGLAVINRASLYRRVVERIHLGLALGDKADMCRPGIRIALSQPEENTTVSSKTLGGRDVLRGKSRFATVSIAEGTL
jgi:hypothetical protein